MFAYLFELRKIKQQNLKIPFLFFFAEMFNIWIKKNNSIFSKLIISKIIIYYKNWKS